MASKTVIINGVTYSTVPEVDIPIQGGGGALAKFFEISDATVTSADMLFGVKAYGADGSPLTGEIQTKTLENLAVSSGKLSVPSGFYAVDSSINLEDVSGIDEGSVSLSASGSQVTATVPSRVWFSTAGTSSLTIAGGTATTPATTIAPTITSASYPPGTNNGRIRITVTGSSAITPNVVAGYITSGTTGTVTVSGESAINLTELDSDLAAGNIRSGVTIFGIAGDSNVVNTSIASTSAATSAAILSPYQAYVNGQLVTGSVESKTSADLIVSGKTVTAPAGYYATNASKSVADGSVTIESKTINANTSVSINSAGLITATVNDSDSISASAITVGYVERDDVTDGTVTVAGSSTLQLAVPTQLTVSGGTVTAPSGYYPSALSKTLGTGAITASGSAITIEPVASINNSTGVVTVATQTQNVTVNAHVATAGYVTTAQDSSATVAVTLKDNTTLALTTKAAATYTPGTQAQSVPSYRWLTGAQTIAGDTDLVSANIKSGVSIFGVAGSSTVVDTNDATATSADLLSGKTAYVKGAKVTGNIATKSSADMTVSGKTVTAPAGYYASAASKSVADGSATTPAKTITATVTPSLNTSTGVVSITVAGSSSVTPTVSAGYVTAGTAGTISVSGSSSLQLTTKAAQTYTPGTQNITIAAGQYLTGTQTIQGDANLQPGYIVSGKSIFGVAGTLSLPTITQDTVTKVLTIS